MLATLEKLLHCVSLTLDEHQVPTKAALTLPSSAGKRRKNAMEGSIQGQVDITHQLTSWAEQAVLTCYETIYYQSKQNRIIRNKPKS